MEKSEIKAQPKDYEELPDPDQKKQEELNEELDKLYRDAEGDFDELLGGETRH